MRRSIMAFIYGDRHQKHLFPPSVDEYIEPDAPVRAYDAFVEALDLDELGIDTDSRKVGNPRYEPKAMLKLQVYGYSYGIRSSRKLERETHYNLSFIWLTGGLKPDHKTIAEFRRNNKSALKKVLKQCAHICVELKLIAGNTLFIDGTKIRANASISNSWSKKRCEKALSKIDERIEEMLSQCEAADEAQAGQPSWVGMEEELGNAETLKSRVKGILKEITENGRQSHNVVDTDCTKIKGRQGSHAGYNAQIVVDEEYGLIVSSDVVSENNDLNQFSSQVEHANEVLDKKCETACADAGYATTDELKKIADQNIKVVVPSKRQTAGERKKKEFDKEKFRYDRDRDCYICPEGNELSSRSMNKSKGCRNYRIVDAHLCLKCPHFGRCTKDRFGRSIQRFLNEDLKEKFEADYKKPESREIYNLRKQKVELPFGHMKRNLGVNGFLLRGLEGVRGEMSLFATCFNMARMITIFGVKVLIRKMKEAGKACLRPAMG